MLSDYIEAYTKAFFRRDTKEKKRIEAETRKLGIDKITLIAMCNAWLDDDEHQREVENL